MPRRNGDRLLIGVIVFVFGIWAVFALIGSNSGAAQSNEECYFDPVTFEVICPDPTPTPTPTSGPTATLSASRTTIEVGESTLISGDVEPADADTMWVVGEGLSMSSCPTRDTRSLRQFPPPQLRVWGCKAGSHEVSLKIRGATDTLADITITVTRIPPPPNRRPTVTIVTQDQTVDGGASVSLDATASDPDGDDLTYSWSGSGSFRDSISLDTRWSAPAAQSSDQTYTLMVEVSDGSLNDTDSVSITVRGVPPPNRRPTVTIVTQDQTVDGGASVSLDATASDPDGDDLTYSWSGSGSFRDSISLDTRWSAPAAQSSDRNYTLMVEVSDGSLNDTDSVSITVRGVPPPNRRPTVTIVTQDQTVDGGASVSLDATASDPDGDDLTYSWSGSGSFRDSTSLDTRWSAPAAQSSDQTYTLMVEVSDGSLNDTDSVSITVRRRNRTPTVMIETGPQTVDGGGVRIAGRDGVRPGRRPPDLFLVGVWWIVHELDLSGHDVDGPGRSIDRSDIRADGHGVGRKPERQRLGIDDGQATEPQANDRPRTVFGELRREWNGPSGNLHGF